MAGKNQAFAHFGAVPRNHVWSWSAREFRTARLSSLHYGVIAFVRRTRR